MTKIAVVTGGTAGIGRATVRALTDDGYDVAVLARGQDGLKATVAEIEAAGRRGLAVPTDVADAAAVEEAAERVEATLGAIDLWVNSAFAGAISYFEDVRPDEFDRITAVTYLGQVNGTRAALRRMRPRDQGTIINVSSALAHRGIPLQAAYCGAKHAIVGFTESLRAELRDQGSAIRLSLVALPGVNTPQFTWVLRRGIEHHPQPVPPIFQPEVAARAIAYTARHPRRSVWVGSSTFATVLGNRIAPAFMDWYLGRTNVQAQQNPEHDPPAERTNLWEPVPGDAGAHGPFDDEAKTRSPLLELTLRGGTLAAGAAAAGLGVLDRVLSGRR
jgi:NAD(P)-dependent dehydrogenase (short-subunit alcohol dehydrogenase family)